MNTNMESENCKITETDTLTAFRLKNFKAFVDTGWIKLNHLTLLLGNNSSGKSALYQALRMLSRSYEKLLLEERFTNLSQIADEFGTFDDICNKSAITPLVEITFLFSCKEGNLEYSIHLTPGSNDKFGQVAEVLVKKDKEPINLLKFYNSINIFFLEKKSIDTVAGIHETEIREMARRILSALRNFAQTFQIIHAQRYIPVRSMLLSGSEPKHMNPSGSNTYDILYYLSEIQNEKAPLTSSWLEKFGYSYHWKMAGMNRGEFMLCDLKTGMESNLVDNGFGISQSLPLALALDTLNGGTVLLDSPEAFLQTKMQSEMGDLLINGSEKGNILLETGSEYLTLRIRRRIAEGKISHQTVSIYFINETDQGQARCESIEINENGEFINTSEQFAQFFSSDFFDIEQLDAIRRQKSRHAEKNSN